jgi:hypothetical protein
VSSKYREWFFESAKFASAVFTYWLIKTLIPWEPDFVLGKILEAVFEITLASSIAFLLWGFVVGRPTVELRWRKDDNQIEPESGRPTITSGQSIKLQVHVSGDSWTCRLIRLYVRNRGLKFEIDLQPESHLVSVQRGRISTLRENEAKTGLIFYGIRPEPRIHAALELRVRRDDGLTGGYPIDIRLSQRWSPEPGFGWPKLLKVETGVEGFYMQGG